MGWFNKKESEKIFRDAVDKGLLKNEDFIGFDKSLPSPFKKVPAKANVKGSPKDMNKTEALYATILAVRLEAGELAGYWFHGITLLLADDCRYTPDFLVQIIDGSLEIHEIKGGSRKEDGSIWFHGMDDSMIKMRLAADKYPFKVMRVIHLKNEPWDFKEIKSL